MKICIKCSSEFVGRYCKVCDKNRKSMRRKENPEKIKSQERAAYIRNREQKRLAAKIHYQNNSESKKEASYKWRIENPELRRIYNRNRRAKERGGKLSKNLIEKLLILQKGKCACCGELLNDDYHLDHIMPLALGGKNSDNNIQLLKSKCNMQKHTLHPVDFMQLRGFLL